ncbi:MAG: ABC transporter substrate-binding protein [Usitatibacter sp.]
MSKRFAVSLFTVLLGALASATAHAQEPIKIGVPMTLSGIAAQVGVDNRNGILLAAKQKKTLLGRPIQLIVEDDEGKPDVGLRKAEKMIFRDGAVVLLGVAFTNVGLAIAKEAGRLGVPFVTTNVMTPDFYNIHKYVFRAGQLADDQTATANVKGIVAIPDLKKRTYYVLADDYAWGHSCAEAFIELAKAHGVKVHSTKYDNAALNVTDWAPFVSKIAASGADGVYSCLRSPILPRFIKQASEFGLMKKVKVVAGGSPSEAALESSPQSQVGIVTASAWAWSIDTPASQKFAKEYYQEYKAVPPAQGAQAYVGAMILFNAIEKAGNTKPEAIAAALKGATFDGPYGVVRISASDNSLRTSAVLTETELAPPNPFEAKIIRKVLVTLAPEQVGPPEK